MVIIHVKVVFPFSIKRQIIMSKIISQKFKKEKKNGSQILINVLLSSRLSFSFLPLKNSKKKNKKKRRKKSVVPRKEEDTTQF